MIYDVIIIGGSFAGLSAAMQLVRGSRNVLVIDKEQPRNRFASESHGIFCLDGKSPEEIQVTALSQLAAYPTFQHRQGEVNRIERQGEGFPLSIVPIAMVMS